VYSIFTFIDITLSFSV
jgi:hypothetical protein